MNINSQILSDLKSRYHEEIVIALISSFEKIAQNFLLEKFEPSELNGGKFTEAMIRILKFETDRGNYTPVGDHIHNMKAYLDRFAQTPKNCASYSFRITIPRVLIGIYDIRNNRGVGHLGGDVNPNYQDCSYILCAAKWVMCELFRIHYSCSLNEAESIVNSLIKRPSVLIADIDSIKRVLNPSLKLSDQVLILLYHEYPNKLTIEELIKWIEPNTPRYFKNSVITKLHEDRFIERSKNGDCLILDPGIQYSEKNIEEWIRI